jgi:Tol biopolymer transport system component
LKDETATRTGAFEVLSGLGLRPTRTFLSDWGEEGVLFSVLNDDNQDLWSMKLSGGKVRGAPQRLTTGAGRYSDPLFAGAGRIVFTNGTNTEAIWSLPADGDLGKVNGPPQPLTPGAAWKAVPSVSADGRLIVFASVGTGISGDDIFVFDTASRKPKPLTNTPLREYYPVITRDGRRLAYRINEHDRTDRPVFAMSSAGGEPELICENGDRPTSWSPDGKRLLLMTGGPKVVNLLDVASHKIRQYLGAPGWDFRHAKFSPDGRWVAFLAARVGAPARPFVVPYAEGSTPKESDWIAVTEQDAVESDLDWSPNGRLLYFATRADGRFSLFVRRFEPSSGTLSGAPFSIYTFSDVRRPPPRSFPISVAQDKIVFSLETMTSEVWLLTP